MAHPTRIFKEPKDLELAFLKYKDTLKQQEADWLKVQYVGKDGERKADGTKVPMTFEGFKRYCYNQKEYGCIEQYFINKDDLYIDFVSICTHIKNEIRENQIIGGMLGFYNSSITQRLNGLTDKKETTHKGGINIPNLPDIGNR